jgi:hypothetical protein
MSTFLFLGLTTKNANYIFFALPFLWIGIFLIRKDPELQYHERWLKEFKLATVKKAVEDKLDQLEPRIRAFVQTFRKSGEDET